MHTSVNVFTRFSYMIDDPPCVYTSNIKSPFLHPIISLAFPPRRERSKQILRYIALYLSSIDLRSGNNVLWIIAQGPFEIF